MDVIKKVKHGKIVDQKSFKKGNSKKVAKVTGVKIKLRKRGSRAKRKRSVSGNKLSGITKSKSEELINPLQVTDGVQALLQLDEKTAVKKKKLFGDEPQPIFIQVAAVRVPKTPSRRLRFKLPHPVITDSSDVCLFVGKWNKKYKNRKIKRKRNIVEVHKERFAKAGISEITEVITLKRLLREYNEFEEKRRLCQQFDVFLSDVSLGNSVAVHFGKFLKYSLKTPIPVNIHTGNLKEVVSEALSKTTMNIHGKGDSFIVQVGHTKQPVNDIVQNISSVSAGLALGFPGGWDNVSAVYIKTKKSLAVPIYVSLKSPNDVPVPVVKPKRRKAMAPVEGELSTRLGYTAKVFAAGKVQLKKEKKKDSDVEWSDDEDDWDNEWRNFENKVYSKRAESKNHLEEEEEDEKPAKKDRKKISKEDSDTDVKEEELEDEVADVEESYLQQWDKKREDDNDKKRKLKGEVSNEPKRKKVKYVVGEMCLGRLENEAAMNVKKTSSGGMAQSAFKALKSKMSRKKLTKKQNTPQQNKSVICSNKSSKTKKKEHINRKTKGKISA